MLAVVYCFLAEAENERKTVKVAFPTDEKTITLSAGVCITDQDYSNMSYRLVDDALYHTKHKGRSGCTLMDENHQIMDYWSASSAEDSFTGKLEV